MNKNLTQGQREKGQDYMISKINVPCKFGAEATDPDNTPALDCSELAEMVYKYMCFKLPDGARFQYKNSIGILPKGRDTFDLVFFKGKDGIINHVGILYDRNIVIEASGSKGKVRMMLFTEFEKGRGENIYVGVFRPESLYKIDIPV